MPAVLVHGVPDTHRVWRALIGRLRRHDVVTLSLPGFGCAIASGFDCTKEAYCDWLLGRLSRNARFVAFAGCSHWWQLERSAGVAKELEAFWERP